jgi:hypothetical protein
MILNKAGKSSIDSVSKFILFALFTFCSVAVIVQDSSVIHPYMGGEWLINYSAGFIRRGLAGSVILGIAKCFGVNPGFVLNLFVTGLFFSNLGLIAHVIRSLSLMQTYWFLFAPAMFLMIPFDDMERKDSLFYFILLVHCTLCVRKSAKLKVFQTHILPSVGIVVGLIHELYAFFIPYHLILIASTFGNKSQRTKTLSLNIIPILTFPLACIFRGTTSQTSQLIEGLWNLSPVGDFSAIEVMALPPKVIFGRVLEFFREPYSLGMYTFIYITTNLITVFAFKFSLKKIRHKNLFWAFIWANALIFVMLWAGQDFGRWITLFSIHNFLLLAALQTEIPVSEGLLNISPLKWLTTIFLPIILSFSLFTNHVGEYPQESASDSNFVQNLCPDDEHRFYREWKLNSAESRMFPFLKSGLGLALHEFNFNPRKFSMQAETPKKISLGQPLNFCDSGLAFRGWCAAESDHRWTCGRKVAIDFYLEPYLGQPMGLIELAVGTLGAQRLEVYLNQSKVFENTVDQVKLRIKYPPQLLKYGEVANRLEFYLPDAHQPDNGDDRMLGIFLTSFTIN